MCEVCISDKVHALGMCSSCYMIYWRSKGEDWRIKGSCSQCGEPIYSSRATICWKCYKENKASAKEAHKEDKKQVRKDWRANNSARVLENHQKWVARHKDDPDYQNKVQAYTETRRARLFEADDGFSAEEWLWLLEKYKQKCAYCLQEFSYLEQDHVMPLSLGGRHALSNIVPACRKCNRSKSANYWEPKHPAYKIILEIVKIMQEEEG